MPESHNAVLQQQSVIWERGPIREGEADKKAGKHTDTEAGKDTDTEAGKDTDKEAGKEASKSPGAKAGCRFSCWRRNKEEEKVGG